MTNARDELWFAGGPVEGLGSPENGLENVAFHSETEEIQLESAEKIPKGGAVSADEVGEAVNFTPDPFFLALERQEVTEKSADPDENQSTPSLFDLASYRVGLRAAGYGQENSFPAIRRLWNAFLRNRPLSADGFIDLTDSEVADMLLMFKVGRKQTRRAVGKFKRDDNVDCAGYLYWADRLEKDKGESVDG